MINIGNIVCPIDFSDYSRRALDHAVAIARRYDSLISLVHVCATMPASRPACASTASPLACLLR